MRPEAVDYEIRDVDADTYMHIYIYSFLWTRCLARFVDISLLSHLVGCEDAPHLIVAQVDKEACLSKDG